MSYPSEILQTFAQFGRERRVQLRDPESLRAFGKHLVDALEKAVASNTHLHGHRTQNMFEALVVSLGRCRLIQVQDAGRVHSEEALKIPDFLIVLRDGRRWLVEVKNVFDAKPDRQVTRFTAGYVKRLQAYADATGCELKLALYWARWSLWTLIAATDLLADGEKLSIDMFRASRINQLAALGDVMVGTKPPMRLRLVTDPSKPRIVDDRGEATVTIASVELMSGQMIVVDDDDRAILWLFMEFGEWELSGPHAVMSGNDVEALEFVWNPRERQNEGFEIVGSLSRMFARYFSSQTLEGKDIKQLNADTVPEWFKPLVEERPKKEGQLPLWRLILSPNREVEINGG